MIELGVIMAKKSFSGFLCRVRVVLPFYLVKPVTFLALTVHNFINVPFLRRFVVGVSYCDRLWG